MELRSRWHAMLLLCLLAMADRPALAQDPRAQAQPARERSSTLPGPPARTQDPSWDGPFTVALLTRNLAAVPERRVRFSEERRFAALDQPLHSQGILLWRRPDVLEKHTEAPQPETLRVEGDRVEVFLPAARRVQ